MSINQAFFLAIVQGLTEFLPVSSSGHLVIFQKILGFEEPPFFFDILVHVGTLGAILVFFRDKIFAVFKDRKLLLLLFLGTLPVCFLALFLEKFISQIFSSLRLTGFSYLFTAVILFSTYFLNKQTKKIKDLSWLNALVIGFFQALAIFPGVSRSGMTISAGLWCDLTQSAAFDFSILLGAPAMLGALVLRADELPSFAACGFLSGVLGMIVSGLVGYFTLKLLKDFVEKGKLYLFGFYCCLIGLMVLWFECVLKF